MKLDIILQWLSWWKSNCSLLLRRNHSILVIKYFMNGAHEGNIMLLIWTHVTLSRLKCGCSLRKDPRCGVSVWASPSIDIMRTVWTISHTFPSFNFRVCLSRPQEGIHAMAFLTVYFQIFRTARTKANRCFKNCSQAKRGTVKGPERVTFCSTPTLLDKSSSSTLPSWFFGIFLSDFSLFCEEWFCWQNVWQRFCVTQSLLSHKIFLHSFSRPFAHETLNCVLDTACVYWLSSITQHTHKLHHGSERVNGICGWKRSCCQKWVVYPGLFSSVIAGLHCENT